MKFVYPTPSIDIDDTNDQTKMTIGDYGNFPLTNFNTWHGGVHIPGSEAPLQAIANGRIIAFKMTENYETQVHDFWALDSEDEAFRQQKYRRLYAKAFILVQHDYQSPIGQKLRYYSFYHHVMPVDYIIGKDPRTEEEKKKEKKQKEEEEKKRKEAAKLKKEEAQKQQLEADKKNPPKYKVTAKKGKIIKGLLARQPINGEVGFLKKEHKLVIPKGEVIIRAQLDGDKTKKKYTSYHRISYKGNFYYVSIPNSRNNKKVKDLGNDHYEVLTKNDTKEDTTLLGAKVQEQANSTSDTLKIIPTDTEIEIDVEGSSEEWKKLKDGSGFINSTGLERIQTEADKEATAAAQQESAPEEESQEQKPIKDPLPTKKELPDFISKKAYTVAVKDGIPLDAPIKGWWAKLPYQNEIGTKKHKLEERKVVIPKDTIVAKAPLENDPHEKGSYKRIAYQGDVYYIHTELTDKVTDLGEEGYKIITDEDIQKQDKSVLGARIYQEPNTSASILKIIPYADVVEIDTEVKGDWKKLKDEEGYVQAASIAYTKSYDEEQYPYDQVHACDHLVKAGDLLGYVGKFGYQGSPFSNSSHFEIFTDDEEQLPNFLSNAVTGAEGEKDGTDQLRYSILKGATLTTNLTKSVTIKAKTPVKVLVRKGKYAKVKVVSIQKIVVKDADVYYKGTNSNRPSGKGHSASISYYHIHNAFISSVSATFDQKFDKNTVLFFDGHVNKDDKDSRRKVRYYPEHYNKEFWINREALTNNTSPHDAPGADLFNIELTTSFDTQLKQEVNTVYITEPKPEPEQPITIQKTKKLTNKKLKEEKGENEEVWYYIDMKQSDSTGKEIAKEGWIKKTDPKLKTINPFKWGDYGFSLLDAGSEYVYSVQDYNEQKNTSPFVKTLWETLDTGENDQGKGKGDGKITKQELQRAYRNPEIVDQLSKYICKHKSEWSYTPATIESEAEQFFEIGIQKEKEDGRKKILEDEKKFILDKLTEKTEKLMWWQEVQNAIYTPPEPVISEEEQNKVENRRDFGITPKKKVLQIEAPQSHDAIQLRNGKPFQQPTTKVVEETPTVASTPTAVETETVNPPQSVATPETTLPSIEEPPIERTLPSTDTVWHFHPLAFIKQMRVMYPQGGCEPLIWGNKVSCEFRYKVLNIAKNLWGEDKKIEMANNLMAVFAWESGGTFKPDAPNMANSGATGLIQFMPDTAASLLGKKKSDLTIEKVTNYWGKGRTLERVKEFARMTAIEQLYYVEKYFKPLKGKDVEFVDFYLQVLFPASMGKPDDHVVFSKDGTGLDKNDRNYKKRISSYEQNKGFDTNPKSGNNDGMVTKAEIKTGVQKYLDKGKLHQNNCNDSNCTLSGSNNYSKLNSDLKIEEGLIWAESLAVTESQLRANPNTPYIIKYPHPWEYGEKLRARETEESLEYMDCTELVCRYLHKIEWSGNIKVIHSSGFKGYSEEHPDKLMVNHGDPKPGDIFAWNGHAGVVKNYDSATKKVTTIESISEEPYSWHEGIKFDGVVIWTYDKDKNHLRSNEDKGKTLEYYTPLKHYSK